MGLRPNEMARGALSEFVADFPIVFVEGPTRTLEEGLRGRGLHRGEEPCEVSNRLCLNVRYDVNTGYGTKRKSMCSRCLLIWRRLQWGRNGNQLHGAWDNGVPT